MRHGGSVGNRERSSGRRGDQKNQAGPAEGARWIKGVEGSGLPTEPRVDAMNEQPVKHAVLEKYDGYRNVTPRQ